MPGLHSASVSLTVLAGGRDEMPAQNGIAHFLEHMAFKGTARRSALEIAEVLENVGGYLNAYTDYEETSYQARVLGADLPLALDVLADIARNPALDPVELERERGVILSEIGLAEDRPDELIFDHLQAACFPDQALGRPLLGPADLVRGFGREEFVNFRAAHYHPRNMILAAAGDVDHDALVAQAEVLFGDMDDIAPPMRARGRFDPRPHLSERAHEQAHLALAFEGKGHSDPDRFVGHLFAAILGGGMSSRLFQEAREKRGLCYSIYAQTQNFADTGFLWIEAGTDPDNIGALADVVVDELRRIMQGVTPEELARARTQHKAGMLMAMEQSGARAGRLTRQIVMHGELRPVDETVALIDAVDHAALRNYAEDLLQKPPAMAALGPLRAARPYETIVERIVG